MQIKWDINCINSISWIGIEQKYMAIKTIQSSRKSWVRKTPPPTSHNKIDFREILRKALTRNVVWEKKCLSWRRQFGKKSSFGTWNKQLASKTPRWDFFFQPRPLWCWERTREWRTSSKRYLGFFFSQRCFMCLQCLFLTSKPSKMTMLPSHGFRRLQMIQTSNVHFVHSDSHFWACFPCGDSMGFLWNWSWHKRKL